MDILTRAWRDIVPHVMLAAAFSGLSNLLQLTPTIYLLILYQRVIPTHAFDTLIGTTVIALVAIGGSATLDALRLRVMARANLRMNRIASRALVAAALNPTSPISSRQEIFREFDSVRQVATGPVIVAFLDLPWLPIYIVAGFMLHPVIGLYVCGAAAILFVVALVAHSSGKPLAATASASAEAASHRLRLSVWRADALQASGMRAVMIERHTADRKMADISFKEAVFLLGDFNSLSRFLRQAGQVGILGCAAFLVVKGEANAGVIFAGSLLLNRALAPIDQINGGMRQLVQARRSSEILRAQLRPKAHRPYTKQQVSKGELEFRNAVIPVPGTNRPLVVVQALTIRAGESVMISGASGSGKSSVLRAVAGALPVLAGGISIDGSDVKDWDPDLLAGQIGYVAAQAVLLPGTLHANISRFATAGAGEDGVDDLVLQAAKNAGCHEMISRMPLGYNTNIGDQGEGLSAGQSHRVALARGLYKFPSLLMFDEPDSHLDKSSLEEMVKTIRLCKSRGSTLLFISHKDTFLNEFDRHFEINEGRMLEVMRPSSND